MPGDLGAEETAYLGSVSVLMAPSKQLSLFWPVCPANFVKNSVNKAKAGVKISHRL